MEIDLGKGRIAVIDDEDAALVAGFKWYAMKATNGWYPAGWKHMPPGRFFVHGFVDDTIDAAARRYARSVLPPERLPAL